MNEMKLKTSENGLVYYATAEAVDGHDVGLTLDDMINALTELKEKVDGKSSVVLSVDFEPATLADAVASAEEDGIELLRFSAPVRALASVVDQSDDTANHTVLLSDDYFYDDSDDEKSWNRAITTACEMEDKL